MHSFCAIVLFVTIITCNGSNKRALYKHYANIAYVNKKYGNSVTRDLYSTLAR